jgi:hypothetical protein
LLVLAQGVLAARGVFGQEDVGVGAVGAEGQGVFGKLGLAVLVGLLGGPVHERRGLGQRGIRLGLAPLRTQELLHRPFQHSGVGEVTGRLLVLPLRASATRLSLLAGHRAAPAAMLGGSAAILTILGPTCLGGAAADLEPLLSPPARLATRWRGCRRGDAPVTGEGGEGAMSAVAKLCPYCSAPLQSEMVSPKGFTKATYACGTVLGYYRQQTVPVRSPACRRNARPAQQDRPT